MGQIFTGEEGYREMLFGNAAHTLDSNWTLYEEAFSREFQLEKAGYSVRRTELLDSEGKISGRGVPTMIYSLWIRRGHVEKTRGRKPKIIKGKFGAKKKDPRFSEDQRTTGSDRRTTAKRPTGRSDPRSAYEERGKCGGKTRIAHKIVKGAKNAKYAARRNIRANLSEKARRLR